MTSLREWVDMKGTSSRLLRATAAPVPSPSPSLPHPCALSCLWTDPEWGSSAEHLALPRQHPDRGDNGLMGQRGDLKTRAQVTTA